MTENKPEPGIIYRKAEPIDSDLADPVMRNDTEISPARLAFLQERAKTCFLCKWILDDYLQHGTLRGVHRSASPGEDVEIFPKRGEIDHLWLEFYGRPYDWNEPIKPVEKEPTKIVGGKLVPVRSLDRTNAPVPVAKPVPAPSDGSSPKNPVEIPVAKPKRIKLT